MITIEKSNRILRYNGKTYSCSLGSCPVGTKQKEGDGKTPEGRYYVCTKNALSKFHLSLGISYPNADDAEIGLQSGLISIAQYEEICRACKEGRRPPWDTPLGGFIMIHGEKNGGAEGDWTKGCIALKNSEIEELFESVNIGETVEIFR